MLKEGEFNVSKTREDVRKMNKEMQNSLQQQEVLQVSKVKILWTCLIEQIHLNYKFKIG